MTESHTMWPLDQEAISSHIISAKSISEHLAERVPKLINVAENAWLTEEDIELLRSVNNGHLVDADDRLLASIGNGDHIVLAQSSFLIQFAWHILAIAEDLIGNLKQDKIQGSIHPNAVVEGHITLGAGSRILPGVYIEGNVTIGENCKIGPNCYIRGNTSIGNNCHIGQSVEVKNSVIGNDTNVGHLSYVGDSVIGDHANCGAGTITSNFRHDGNNHRSFVDGELLNTGRRKFGTIIADGVHTGINTAIYPGRKIGKNASTLPSQVVKADIHS